MQIHPNRSKKVQVERRNCFQSPLVHTTIKVSIMFPPFTKEYLPARQLRERNGTQLAELTIMQVNGTIIIVILSLERLR